jgi:hypothetical protein
MKIRYTETSPRAGQVEHIENTVGKTLIALGHAEEMKLPRRGDPDWLAERNEQATLATAPHKDDIPVPFAAVEEWGVRDKTRPGSQVLIVKRFQYDTFFFTKPPKDCPATIVEKFKALSINDEQAGEELAEKKRKVQAESDKHGKAPRWTFPG